MGRTTRCSAKSTTYDSVAFALGKLAAVLGRLGDAEAHFEAALASNRKIRAAVWLGHTRVELAKALLRRGEDGGGARAGGLVAAARQTADALGLVRLQRKLDSLDVDGARATAAKLTEGVATLENGGHIQGRIIYTPGSASTEVKPPIRRAGTVK